MQIDLPPEEVTETVLDCLRKNYGISGDLKRLGGENINYRVTTPGGQCYILKIVDDDMPPEVVDMENKAIEHAISAGICFEVPKIVKNKYKKIETGIKLHTNAMYRARLLDFINGNNLEKISDISVKLLQNVGKSLAEFDLAMESFDHPAAYRTHRWNLADAGQHKDKAGLVEDPGKRDLLTWAFNAWQQRAEPYFDELPCQFIHADMNRGNVLVEADRVVGLVDFGDACFNPTVCELAICLCYIMMGQDRPLDTAKTVSAAYQQVRPLSDLEQSVLSPLVCGRLAVTIGVATERKLVDPDHPGWFGSEGLAWNLLAELHGRRDSIFDPVQGLM